MSGRRIWTLRLSWLAAFAKTAQLESQGDAARALGCDQSTISRYIKDLQAWLGKELVADFVPFELTQEGRDFLPTCVLVLDLLIQAQDPSLTKDVGIAGADIDMSWYTPADWVLRLRRRSEEQS